MSLSFRIATIFSAMRIFYLFLLFIGISSCGLYTKSNVNDKKDPKGDLNVEDNKDVRDGYNGAIVSTPLLVAEQKILNTGTRIPVGLELTTFSKNWGDIEGFFYYLTDGFEFNESNTSTFNFERKRFDYRFTYSYPVWRTTEQIDKFQLYLGKNDKYAYYGIFPTYVDIDLSIRGGIDHGLSTFISDAAEVFINKEVPNVFSYDGLYGNVLYYTQNTSLKAGLIFQRKLATRLNAKIDGRLHQGVHYEQQGVYLDIAVLLTPERATESVRVYYYDTSSASNLDEKVFELSPEQLFDRIPVGFSLGYKFAKSSKSSFLSTRFRVECGVTPGYFPTLKSALYARIGFGIGFGINK